MNLDCKNCPFNLSDCFDNGCVSANGIQRAIIVANKMMPGPAIEVCQGDVIILNVLNKLRSSETTSIHFHGIHMKQTPEMDGVSLVTQCPIQQNSYFKYKLKLQFKLIL